MCEISIDENVVEQYKLLRQRDENSIIPVPTAAKKLPTVVDLS